MPYYLSVILSKKGPQCPDTRRLWQFFAENPFEGIEWVIEGTERATDLWNIVWNSPNKLVGPKIAHPLAIRFGDEARTQPLEAAIEPSHHRLIQLSEWLTPATTE